MAGPPTADTGPAPDYSGPLLALLPLWAVAVVIVARLRYRPALQRALDKRGLATDRDDDEGAMGIRSWKMAAGRHRPSLPSFHGDERANEAGSDLEFALVLRILVALVWILWGLKLYQPTFTVSGAPEAGLFYTVGGVLALVLVSARRTARWVFWIDLILLVGTLAAFGLWTRAAVFGSPAYGTDAVAFDQGAAQLLLQHVNPYGKDLSWTFDAFRVLPSGTTNTLSGDFVRHLSYPVGSFLVYVPLLLLGIQAQAAIYVDAFFWIAGMTTLWLVLPRPFKSVVPVLASLGIYVDYATGGVTDSLMVPFMVLALWRWDRFGDPDERSAARWLGPIAFGLACTIKQSAWFLGPLLLIGIAIESLSGGRGWRPVARYLLFLGAAFLFPNLPFIVADPQAWVGGVLVPFIEPLVPFGQGFIAISTTFSQGGGSLTAYTLAAAAMMLAVIVAFVGWYSSLKRLLPVLPLVALLLPTRSLNSYFVYAIPGLLAAITTVRPAPLALWSPSGSRSRITKVAAALVACVSGVALVLALIAPAPLILEPVDQHTTGQLQTIDSLTVIAHNRTDSPITPHFAVALGAYMSSFWLVQEGPSAVPAHGSARYVLVAPNTPSMPGVQQESVLFALTDKPATISSARLFAAIAESTQISPQAVDRIVGDPPIVEFDVAIVDRLNNPVRKPGIQVSLGQVLYTSEGLFPGLASINGMPEGQSPVTASTDSDGVAHFEVRAVQQQPHELFFQAWLQEPFPHGYSSAVAVHFLVDPP